MPSKMNFCFLTEASGCWQTQRYPHYRKLPQQFRFRGSSSPFIPLNPHASSGVILQGDNPSRHSFSFYLCLFSQFLPLFRFHWSSIIAGIPSPSCGTWLSPCGGKTVECLTVHLHNLGWKVYWNQQLLFLFLFSLLLIPVRSLNANKYPVHLITDWICYRIIPRFICPQIIPPPLMFSSRFLEGFLILGLM